MKKTMMLFIALLLASFKNQAQPTQNTYTDDAGFEKALSILSTAIYPGSYIDSTRSIIRTEGESVLYRTEIEFPGTIENYIQATNGKGTFRAVFYQGNNSTTARNKYNEIAETVTRLRGKDHTPGTESYCAECSGISFGFWGTYLWVQIINKPNGMYEVQLIHNMNLNSYYFKKTAAPAVTVPSITTVASPTITQSSQQEDFCAAIQRVVKDYPKNFETLKAEEKKKSIYSVDFETKYSVKGASFTELRQSRISTAPGHYPSTWKCELFKGESTFTDVISLYNDYVSKINACAQKYCILTSTTSATSDALGGNKGQKTEWTVKSVNSGNSQVYANLKIYIEFTLNEKNGKWSIVMWIN